MPLNRPLQDFLVRPTDRISVEFDPESVGWRYLSFRAQALRNGEATALRFPDQEAVVVVVSGGGVSVELDDAQTVELAGRDSVFTGPPWSVYIPPDCGARIVGRPFDPDGRVVIGYGQARPSSSGHGSPYPIVIRPSDVEIEIRGAGNATRQVNNIVMAGFPADRLLVCEVYTPGGNWSGWPPHRHDFDLMPSEAVLEETYYYQVSPNEGWGIARLYFKDDRPDGLWAVRNGDALAVPQGYHPFAATQGYDAYYLNFLAGDRRTMAASDDPDLAWVRQTWPSLKKDGRLPLVSFEGAKT